MGCERSLTLCQNFRKIPLLTRLTARVTIGYDTHDHNLGKDGCVSRGNDGKAWDDDASFRSVHQNVTPASPEGLPDMGGSASPSRGFIPAQRQNIPLSGVFVTIFMQTQLILKH